MTGMVLSDSHQAGFDLNFPDLSYSELQFPALCVIPLALLNALP